MYDRAQIMRRAWELKRRGELGYTSLGAALKDAWAEAKGELAFVEELSTENPAPPPALDRDTLVTLTMGRLARMQILSVGKTRGAVRLPGMLRCAEGLLAAELGVKPVLSRCDAN